MRVAPPALTARLTSRAQLVLRGSALMVTLAVALVASLVHPHAMGRRVTTVRLGASGVRLAAHSGRNPDRSRAPGPDFVRTCLPTASGYHGDLRECDEWAEVNIDRARRAEGLGDIRLPKDFVRRTLHGQLNVVANAERESRGLPALEVSSSLDARAATAAHHDTDPTGPADRTWVSNWAGAYRSPLAADYAWMYDDGPGGTNEDCTARDSSGCWDHRDNILAHFRGSMGADQVRVGRRWSDTEVMVKH